MSVALRNLDFDLASDPATWPFEALVTVLERGFVQDWQPLVAEIRARPWGSVARRVARAAEVTGDSRIETLFAVVIRKAQEKREHDERAQVAERVRDAIKASGLTQTEFASMIGTSASRLNTYASGKVVPSAAMMVRIETLGAADPRTSSA